MHDPLIVAFCIRRPWPSRSYTRKDERGQWFHWQRHGLWWKPGSWSSFTTVNGQVYHWPPMITVWHVEPNGHDSGEICKHWKTVRGRRVRDDSWKWHVHHWRVQLVPLQMLRRRLLTKCEWCGGPSRKGDEVNVSHSWDSARTPWWTGEKGIYHNDCSSVMNAHVTCTCPAMEMILEHNDWGRCARCGRHRGYGASERWLLNAQRLRVIAPHTRNKALYDRIIAQTDEFIRQQEEEPTHGA